MNIRLSILKDISYFNSVMSDYGYIMGDLDYTSELSEQYWEFIDPNESLVVRYGCIAQVVDIEDGSGNQLMSKIDSYKEAFEVMYSSSIEEDQLLELCKLGITIVEGDKKSTKEFEGKLPWVYSICIDKYFSSRVLKKTEMQNKPLHLTPDTPF